MLESPLPDVVIFLPGVMGSELLLDDAVLWPGGWFEYKTRFRRMTDLLRRDLTIGGVIRTFRGIRPLYQTILDDLVSCGYREGADEPERGTLIPMAYDWRRSNSVAAALLADLIDRVVAAHGASATVTLVAHSMGGLVARCYLESERYGQRPGFSAVRALITIGTPHRGAPVALLYALGLTRQLFLSQDQVALLARDPHFPSLYELLPPRGEPCVWSGVRRDRLAHVDIYDADIATKLGLVPENLTAATAFHALLDIRRRPVAVRYSCVLGTAHRTTTALTVSASGSVFRVRAEDADHGGDGTVPLWSAGLLGTHSFAVGGEHSKLYANHRSRDALLQLFGASAGVSFAFERPVVRLSIREPVTTPEGVLFVALEVDGALTEMRARLVIVAADVPAMDAGVVVAAYPLSYEGIAADGLSVQLVAPVQPGLYELQLQTDDGTFAGVPDHFMVEDDAEPASS